MRSNCIVKEFSCWNSIDYVSTLGNVVGPTLLMVFSVTCTICEGPRLDALRSQSVTLANCQYDFVFQHK